MCNKLKVPNYLLTLQSPVLAENTETICGVCHNLAFTELIDAQYELSDMEVVEIARKKIFDFNWLDVPDEVKVFTIFSRGTDKSSKSLNNRTGI